MPEKELAHIFTNSKIEVKRDLKALNTGNVFVEYMSRGKPSGLSTTEADWYCFNLGKKYHIIKTKELKNICREFIKYKKRYKRRRQQYKQRHIVTYYKITLSKICNTSK